ncbi:MAG: hypothetical protein HYZ39_17530 [Mycolicibacterium cosmeticum]|nr:hypothetical protein [Mycolicibacterium cosmeticum]
MSTVNHTSAVFGRRACAVVAAGSAALHATMIGHAGHPVVGVLIAAMAAACLVCAYELWRGCGLRTWCVVAVMNLAMIAVHWSIPAHHHGAVVAEPMSALMTLATAVSLTEAAVATAVLYVLTRRREPSAIM